LAKSLEIMEEMNNKLTDLSQDNSILNQKLNETHQKLNETQNETYYDPNPNYLNKQIKNYKDVLSNFRSNY